MKKQTYLLFLAITSAHVGCTLTNDKELIAQNSLSPAKTYCKKLGGKSENVTDEQSKKIGVCVLPNGDRIDELELYKSTH